MRLEVNGTVHAIEPREDETLVEVLRDRLGLHGTKLACGTGSCGACTVHLDGTPIVSCLFPVTSAADRAVVTIEGLGRGELHSVQRAFVRADALQCGFCTPGFVMEAAAFVDDRRAGGTDADPPDRDEIAAALAGHLCRCGAYERILAAVRDAAGGDGTHHGPLVGTGRVEASAKVTGSALYTSDVRLKDQWTGLIVRSPIAHGRVTVENPTRVPYVSLQCDDLEVRYVGQPIGAVAGQDLTEARAAAASLEIVTVSEPAVIGVDQATADGAARVFSGRRARRRAPSAAEGRPLPALWRRNRRGPTLLAWRPVAAVRRIRTARRGDPRLFEATFTTATQVHTPLEPHATVAQWRTAPGGAPSLLLYVSTQGMTEIRRLAHERWALPTDGVEVVADHVGGGFGGKHGLTADVVAAVELSRQTGHAVRVVFERPEELSDGGNRAGTRSRLSILADPRGRLAALRLSTISDGGISVGSTVASWGALVYGRRPKLLSDIDVVSNTAPSCAFRGPGGPPMAWALEQGVDEIAERTGTDPIEIRRRWDRNHRRRALYDWAAQLPVWRGRSPSGSATGRRRRGVGLAASNWFYFVDADSEVGLRVEAGRLVAGIAVQDPGTGSRTVVARALEAELGIEAALVDVRVGNSNLPHGPSSGGSRATGSIVPAVVDAAAALRRELGVRRDPREPIDWSRVLAAHEGLEVRGRRRADRWGYLTPFPVQGVRVGRGFTGAVHVTEVEVDIERGTTRVLSVAVGLAAGRIWAPNQARNQVEGAVVQGVGFALFEERRLDPLGGRTLTTSLDDYHIPGISDTPEITVHFDEAGWDHVPGGGVGLGEVSTLGMAASIGNAIYNATGWRPLDLPVRPDRLLAGLSGGV